MINAFKLTKRLLYLVLFPVYFVISIGLTNLTDKVFLSFAIALVFLIIGILALEFLARKKYADKANLLTDKCDPEAYRDFLLEMLAKKLSKDDVIQVQLHLSYAYYYCGDFQQMKYILDGIDLRQLESKKKNIKFENLKFEYYYRWFFYFLKVEDIESAEKTLDIIDNLLSSSEGVLREMNESSVRMKHLSLDCRKGEIPDIEEKVKYESEIDKMLRGDKMFYKVSDNNFLGDYYLRNGMNDKAKECFEFVVQNGNKLYMVKEAELKLEELKKEK